jgi:predicted acyl esterase
MRKKILSLSMLSLALMVQAQNTITLTGRDGVDFQVKARKALSIDADRARYPGFKQEELLLKKGTIRREGAMPLPCDIRMMRDVAITLRDGVTIYADVFLPAEEGEYPTIMAWSPYGKEIGGQMLDDIPGRSGVPVSATSGLEKFEAPDPAYWCAHGYVIVNPDKRGAYSSEGDLLYWGHKDALDGVDVINWIADQKWSNGNVGMSGNSWLTVSQWFIASEKPEHLKAIAPWEGWSDHYREAGRNGGIPIPEFPELICETFASKSGLLEDQPRMTVETPYCDHPYWVDKAPVLENITIPAYVVASYTNDVHTHGTFEGFRRISSKDKWLRVHNTQEWYDYYNPEHTEDLRKFFDRYLKGIDNGWEDTPKVRLSVLNPGGVDVVDRVESEWPLARTQQTKYYLQPNGSLSTAKSAIVNKFTYDSESSDNSRTFTITFNEHTEITGYMKLHLWVASEDATDMDLMVKVNKVDKQGNPIVTQWGTPTATGYQRVSMRKLDDLRSTESEPYHLFTKASEQMLKKGEVVPVEIAIWPMGLIFEKGETLKLTVGAYVPVIPHLPFGSAEISVPTEGYTYTPGSNPELITLGGHADECADPAEVVQSPATRNKGKHTILVGGKYDSYLSLPVVPEK